MKVRGLLLVSLVVGAAMAGLGVYAASLLPAGTELPVHWNEMGEANATAPALVALLMPAGMVLFCGLLFAAIPRLEPLQDRLEGSGDALRTIWIGTLAFGLGIEALVAAPAFGWTLPLAFPRALTGLVLIVIGNVLPKTRPGFFVGYRTPWAILDTDNWIATHRLAGKLMMLAGVVLVAAALLPRGHWLDMVVPLTLTGAVFPPLVYSWWLWHRASREARATRGGS